MKYELLEFIEVDRKLIKKLETNFVYLHGDFNSNNILVDKKIVMFGL
ncbi:RIO-like serine/threonine protein kinase [Brassicibacter mesophilus]